MKQLIEDFLSAIKAENASPNTLASYRRDLLKFADAVGPDMDLEALERPDVRRFLERLHDAGLSKASMARALAALKSFCRWLQREGRLKRNVPAFVRRPKTGKHLPSVPTEEMIQRLLEKPLPACSVFPERDLALLEVLYGSGVRVAELVGINIGDIRPGENYILIRGKGMKERKVPLSYPAKEAIAEYLVCRRELLAQAGKSSEGALFVSKRRAGRLTGRSVNRILKDVWAARGLSGDPHCHLLRHAFATHMHQRGADIILISCLLGHSKPSTSETYTQLALQDALASYRAAKA